VKLNFLGSDSTNESSQQGIQPFEYYYSPKAFMNAILGTKYKLYQKRYWDIGSRVIDS